MDVQLLIDDPAFVVSGRALEPRRDLAKDGCPLIVAIHGGGFTYEYFDLPGYSLLERAAARGYGVVGIDRLGYGRSRAAGTEAQTFANSKAWLSDAIGRLWPRFRAQCDGVVLIGHSIGAALALMIAAEPQDWPLAGVAVSGAALAENPALNDFFGQLPPDEWLDSSGEEKDRLMLGRPGSFDPAVTALLHPGLSPRVNPGAGEIYSVWTQVAPDILKAIKVPVHYRMGEQDALWTVNDDVVQALSGLLSGGQTSSAAIVENAGHAIDFHKAGARFHDDQLDFALASVRR